MEKLIEGCRKPEEELKGNRKGPGSFGQPDQTNPDGHARVACTMAMCTDAAIARKLKMSIIGMIIGKAFGSWGLLLVCFLCFLIVKISNRILPDS